jgi:O-acetyl-ADP-ribose deacetylase (regulator of RNase III)
MRELRVGSTSVKLVEGAPMTQLNEALYATVNAQGVLASGFGGAIRLSAGAEIERELRAQAPLLVGVSYLTGPGSLATRGVERIAFGVTTSEPGKPPRRVAVEGALTGALDLLERCGTRSLTLPEVGSRIEGIAVNDAARLLADIVARRIRMGTRLERVVIAGLHLEYLRGCRDRLIEHGATLE